MTEYFTANGLAENEREGILLTFCIFLASGVVFKIWKQISMAPKTRRRLTETMCMKTFVNKKALHKY